MKENSQLRRRKQKQIILMRRAAVLLVIIRCMTVKNHVLLTTVNFDNNL